MRKSILSICTFIVVFLISAGCQREKSYSSTDPISQPPIEQAVLASVTGRITDEKNLPVNGAIVKAGMKTTTTDIDGAFLLNNVTLEQSAGYIQVEKPGYFPGSRTITVNENSLNFISIQLVPETIVGSVSGITGGDVTLSAGGKISFQANSFINKSNQAAYTGNVNVAAYIFDPTSAHFSDEMPGALRGITASNAERGLQSFSMIAVELKGSGGEKLQLANGKPAAIHFPIPSSLQPTAPQTIPLWFFDEIKGLWKEEGTATKQGTVYVGTVSHFSFWNCDAPFPLVKFNAFIKDQNNNPLRGVKVKVEMNVNENAAFGFTDTTGKISGLIPANQNLQLVVYNNCNNVILTRNLGQFVADANLGIISVSTSGLTNLAVAGTVKNCSNAPLANGYVTIYFGNNIFRANVQNGSFSTTVFTCSPTNTIKAVAYDNATNQFGDTATTSVNGSAITIPLTACGTVATEFINYTLNGNATSYNIPGDSILYYRDTTTFITAYDKAFTSKFGFSIGTADTLPGTYSGRTLDITQANGRNYNKRGNFTVTITQYGRKNEFIVGNFTTTISDSANVIPINCNFRIRRTY